MIIFIDARMLLKVEKEKIALFSYSYFKWFPDSPLTPGLQHLIHIPLR